MVISELSLSNDNQGLRRHSSALRHSGVQGRTGDWLLSEVSKKLF